MAMDFNDKPWDGKVMGVWGPEWRAISNNGPMPGYTMDGKLYGNSKLMLAHLNSQYKDMTLSGTEQKKVDTLVSLNEKYHDALMDSVIHWGWQHFHKRVADYPEDRFEKALAHMVRETSQSSGRSRR